MYTTTGVWGEGASMNIQQKFSLLCNTPSDIYQHLPTLNRYAQGCDVVVELGVRSVVSTWALVAAKPKVLVSVDLKHPSNFGAGDELNRVTEACNKNGVKFSFVEADSRTYDIPECDLLFIDTLHNYEVLREELRVQSVKAQKYIIMHDTFLFGSRDESTVEGRGLNAAIIEFLATSPQWRVKEVYTNNNGLTVLERS